MLKSLRVRHGARMQEDALSPSAGRLQAMTRKMFSNHAPHPPLDTTIKPSSKSVSMIR